MAGTLEERVDEALATARASEAAIMTVGAAAFDAAEQARRAAELAERASGFAAKLAEREQRSGEGVPRPADSALFPPEPAVGEIRVTVAPPPVVELEDERLRGFNLRADRLAERLRAIGNRPVSLAA
jgi:hypothetical protein